MSFNFYFLVVVIAAYVRIVSVLICFFLTALSFSLCTNIFENSTKIT